MKAVVVNHTTGLSVEDVPTPVPDDDQVLVQVSNTGFCGSDHSLAENPHTPEGTILGHEVSGTVVEMGKDVQDIEDGLRVIIRPTFCGSCRDCVMGKPYFCQNNRRSIGIGDLPGAFAEYFVVFPQMLIPIPDGVDSQNAALAEAFAASLHGIEVSGKQGGPALVLGGGPIGLALIRLLKIKGFGPIVVSEPVEEKRQLARTLGADEVIDPFQENLGQQVFLHSNGLGFETVFECSGCPDNIQASIDYVSRGGTVCIVSLILKPVQVLPAAMTFKEPVVIASYSNTHEENRRILDWMKSGKLDGKPLITDLISLDQLPETYKTRIHTGKAIKVMLQIGHEF